VNDTRVPPHLEHWFLDPLGDKRPRDRILAKREKVLAQLAMKQLARQRKRLIYREDLNNIESFDDENIVTGEEMTTPSREINTQSLGSTPPSVDDTSLTTTVNSDADDVVSHRLPLPKSAFKQTSVRQRRVAHLIEQTLQNILAHHKFLSGPPSLALAQAKPQDKRSKKHSPIWNILQIPKPRPPERPSLQETLGTSHYLIGSTFQRAHVQITRVEVTNDLHFAKVWWKCLPGHEEAVQREFDLLGVQLRTLLTIRIQLKHSPQLIFIHDTPKQIQIELNTRLDQIEAELRKDPFKDSTIISSLLNPHKFFQEDK
jgi:ribosome-binding factor A